jgi:hypothetical protein
MNKRLFTLLAVILVFAIAGGSFYGGLVFGKSQVQAEAVARRATFQDGSPQFPFSGTESGVPVAPGQPGGLTGRGQRSSGQSGMVVGTIKEIGDGVLVVTDMNGKDAQVKVTDTTLIEKNTAVKLSDLAQGETLMVSGSAAADGVITARSMQVAPQGRFGVGGQGAPVQTPAAP